MAGRSMEVHTERFGTLTVSEDEVVDVLDGIPGFPEFRRFVLVPVDPEAMFWWLQSVDEPGLAFLSVVPWPFFSGYEPELSTSDQQQLGIAEPGDALVVCLVTVHRDPERYTANLLAPLVINEVTRRARQVVLEQDLPSQAELVPGA